MKIPLRVLMFVVIGIASVILFSGCVYSGTRTTGTLKESVENLVYMDVALTRQIPCETLNAEKLPSGRTRVYASFLNKRNATAECQIKVKFKNDSGRVVDETGWMPFVLPRREVVQFEHTSLSTDVKDFTLMLRAAK